MKIRTKLLLAYLAVLLPVILIAFIGVSSTTSVIGSFDAFTQGNLPTDQALRQMLART